ARRRPLARRRRDHRSAVDGPRRPGLTDRGAAGRRRGGDDAAVPCGLGRDGARDGETEGAGGAGKGRGPGCRGPSAVLGGAGTGRGLDCRGPSAFSGGAGACGYACLAASIFSKISSFSGNRYVSWFEYTTFLPMKTSKMPPAPSRRVAVIPYLSLMAACKLEA